jgi:hypothetical protein
VTVFRQPDLSGRFPLDGDGYLALPRAGEVPADRLTRALAQMIAARRRALQPGCAFAFRL